MCRPLTILATTTDDQGHTLVCDAWNRLISVSASTGALISTYAYDAEGRRIEEATPGLNPTELYYDSADQDIQDNTGASGTMLHVQYVWSPVYVNAMVFRDYDYVGGGSFQLNDRVYVTQDANYDVTGLIVYTSSLGADGDANADGTVDFGDLLLIAQHSGTNVPGGDAVGDFNHDGNVDSLDVAILNANFGSTTSTYSWGVAIRFDYSAYGQVTTYKPDLSGTSVNFLAFDYGFQGGWRDPGTGLIYFENRDYSPTMMRWVQQDPMGYINGPDDYLTEADNPINKEDPSGLKTVVVAFGGLGGNGAIASWRRAATTAGKDVEYKEYTWHQAGVAYKDTIDELKAKVALTPEFAKLPADGPFARPECLRNTIVVLGHSFGGNAAYDYINLLKDQGIGVDEVVTADPRHPPGIPPGDTVPFKEPANVFSWENYFETQNILPELFGAQVTGALNVHLVDPNWNAFIGAHIDIAVSHQVLDAIQRAVKDAVEYRTPQVVSAWQQN